MLLPDIVFTQESVDFPVSPQFYINKTDAKCTALLKINKFTDYQLGHLYESVLYSVRHRGRAVGFSAIYEYPNAS